MSKPTRPQPAPAPARMTAGQPQPLPTRTTPAAPPVYHPQTVPKVLQRKAAIEPRQLPAARPSHTPAAPPVYRPQPAQKRLQAKAAGGAHVRGVAGGAARTPQTAQAVHRLQAPSLPAAAVRPPASAAVRPPLPTTQARVAQPKATAGAAPARLPLHTRPAAATQRNAAPARPPAAQVARRPWAGAIQRLVLQISQDDMASNNFERLIDNPDDDMGGSLRTGNPDLPGLPLEQLGTNEQLHLVTHGDGRGRVEGQSATGDVGLMNAEEFLSMLITAGFDPRKHKGAIRLVSCFSGSRAPGGEIFAVSFVHALRDRGFQNAVIAYNGIVRVGQGARIDVAPPDREHEFNTLSAELTAVANEQLRVARRPPNINPQSQEHRAWMADLQRLRTAGDELRNRVNALFRPESMERNVHYTPRFADYPNTRPLPNPWARPRMPDPEMRSLGRKLMEERRQMAQGGSCKIEANRFYHRDNDQDPPSAFA